MKKRFVAFITVISLLISVAALGGCGSKDQTLVPEIKAVRQTTAGVEIEFEPITLQENVYNIDVSLDGGKTYGQNISLDENYKSMITIPDIENCYGRLFKICARIPQQGKYKEGAASAVTECSFKNRKSYESLYAFRRNSITDAEPVSQDFNEYEDGWCIHYVKDGKLSIKYRTRKSYDESAQEYTYELRDPSADERFEYAVLSRDEAVMRLDELNPEWPREDTERKYNEPDAKGWREYNPETGFPRSEWKNKIKVDSEQLDNGNEILTLYTSAFYFIIRFAETQTDFYSYGLICSTGYWGGANNGLLS